MRLNRRLTLSDLRVGGDSSQDVAVFLLDQRVPASIARPKQPPDRTVSGATREHGGDLLRDTYVGAMHFQPSDPIDANAR